MSQVSPESASVTYDQLELPNELTASGPEQSRLRKIARLAGKVGLGAALVAMPVLGTVAAVNHVLPPAHTTAAGMDVSSYAEIGSDAISLNFHAAVAHGVSPTKAGPIDIGANVTFDYDRVSLAGADGKFDTQKAEVIVKDFLDSKPIKDRIVSATEWHYDELGGGTFAGIIGAEALSLWVFKHQRKLREAESDEGKKTIESYRRLPKAIGGAAVVLAASGLIIPGGITLATPNHITQVQADPILESVGLHNISITGPAKAAVDSLIVKGKEHQNQENQFYNALSVSLDTLYFNKFGVSQRAKVPGTKRYVFVDDSQGQPGPLGVAGDYAKKDNSDGIIVGGDTTALGIPLETYELSTLREHAGSKIPAIISLAHHDASVQAMQQMIKGYSNYHIADGEVQTIGGVHFIGFNDPDTIPFGGIDKVINPALPGETIDQAYKRKTAEIIKKVCSLKEPVVAEMHNEQFGDALAQANCPSLALVLDGREFYPQQPRLYPNDGSGGTSTTESHDSSSYNDTYGDGTGQTSEFISGSTGGHYSNENFGLFSELTSPASFVEVTVEAKTDQVLDSESIVMIPSPAPHVIIQDIMPSSKIQPIVTSPPNYQKSGS